MIRLFLPLTLESTCILLPILGYFVANYFILKRYFPKQHNTGWLTLGCIVASRLMFFYPDVTIPKNILHKLFINLVIHLGTPYFFVFQRLSKIPADFGIVFVPVAGIFTLFALLQILIQCIFARKFFGKPIGQVFVPLVITALVSWCISIVLTIVTLLLINYYFK
ncbi:MAG: hypothetical protein AB7R69_06600 [Candidatus Babeliales bacterium]